MTMITPSYLGETIEYSSLHACRSTLEDPTNAYGRQIDSSIRAGLLGNSPLEMVFIRAPRIEHVGPGVEVIATEGSDPVAVRQGNAMAATFHPELSDDTRVHRAFLDIVSSGKKR